MRLPSSATLISTPFGYLDYVTTMLYKPPDQPTSFVFVVSCMISHRQFTLAIHGCMCSMLILSICRLEFLVLLMLRKCNTMTMVLKIWVGWTTTWWDCFAVLGWGDFPVFIVIEYLLSLLPSCPDSCGPHQLKSWSQGGCPLFKRWTSIYMGIITVSSLFLRFPGVYAHIWRGADPATCYSLIVCPKLLVLHKRYSVLRFWADFTNVGGLYSSWWGVDTTAYSRPKGNQYYIRLRY